MAPVASRVCLHCDRGISARQQALQCYSCHKWQHRVCGDTEVTQEDYRAASRRGVQVHWQCSPCIQRYISDLIGELTLSPSDPAPLPPTRYVSPPPGFESLSTLRSGALPLSDLPPPLDFADIPAPIDFSDLPPPLDFADAAPTSFSDTDIPAPIDFSDLPPPLDFADAVSPTSPSSPIPSPPSVGSTSPTAPSAPAARGGRRKKKIHRFASFNKTAKTAQLIPHGSPVKSAIDDALDRLHLPTVHLPDTIQEDELTPYGINPDAIANLEADPDYLIIEGSSKRGHPRMVDKLGFSYTIARVGKTVTSWRCTGRGLTPPCNASVQQRGEDFSRRTPHNHPGDPSAASTARIYRDAKRRGRDQLFEPALQIVEAVIREERDQHGHRPGVPNMDNVARVVNLHREKCRPDEPGPGDLFFTYDEDFIPGFLVGDLHVSGHRHMLFADRDQLTLLGKSKTWYVDGTFKIIKKPFVQLWSIHAFVQKGDDSKQLPLLYVFMSSRRTQDYVAIFQHLNSILRETNVIEMVLDFERALWSAIAEVYPQVHRRGCAFHWTQAVYRHIQHAGLQTAYSHDLGVHQVCKQLLGLPFVPAVHIEPIFEVLEKAASPSERMKEVMDYVRDSWIDCNVWTPDTWSIFGQSIRTNNDVEAWHHRINTKAKKDHVPFYLLLVLLNQESDVNTINVQLISEQRLRRQQRTKYQKLQADIFDAWDRYAAGEMSASQLLDTCSNKYKPVE